MKICAFPALLCAFGFLTGCLPEESSLAPGAASELTPRDVETVLDAFVEDLGRVLSVTEPLEDDARSQAVRVLEDPAFQELIQGHVSEIEAIAAQLQGMKAEERAAFSEKILPAVQFIELRMEAVCSSGPAAEDAFAPLFVAVQEALRGSL